MATTLFGTQSVLAGPAGGLTFRKNVNTNQLFFAKSCPRLRRNATVTVRCMAEGDEPEKKVTSPSKVSTKFSDVLAFSGPGPERINGRLAMVGFVAAMAVELSKGENVFAQLSDGGVTWFLATTAVLTVASLVPLFKGVTAESKSGGLMTSDAELWNGRFAMLGLVALAFTEFVKDGTLV